VTEDISFSPSWRSAGDFAPNVVEVRHLSITYGSLSAVSDVSFGVSAGQVVGLVGPNGAGKTSIVETVGGLRSAVSGGSVSVFGHDPQRDRKAVSHLIGMQLQDSLFPSRARVSEVCAVYEAIYQAPRSAGRLLRKFGIADRRHSLISSLSGGMRQRLALALAQIGNVRLVILDELTTGLDPEQRRETWRSVLDLADRGVSILLTSHYMDEIETLCSQVGVLRDGRMVVFDSPSQITAAYGGMATFSVDVDQADPVYSQICRLGLRQVSSSSRVGVSFAGIFPRDYNRLVQVVMASGRPASIVGHKSPTFEDAYLRLVHGSPLKGA
jgi:ABC-2 type transport system ATP-binding protein